MTGTSTSTPQNNNNDNNNNNSNQNGESIYHDPLSASLVGNEKKTTSRTKRPQHITWDEETIAEHDKERGTRQKIDEPPTPYHYFDEEGNEIMTSQSGSTFSVSSSTTTATVFDKQTFKSEDTSNNKNTKIMEKDNDHNDKRCDDKNSTITPRNTLTNKEQTTTQLDNTLHSILDENNINILASKLQEVSNAGPGIAVKDENGEEYIPPLRTQNEKKAFSSKRQQHYDEFLKMKEYKEKLAKGLLDDEDDEG